MMIDWWIARLVWFANNNPRRLAIKSVIDSLLTYRFKWIHCFLHLYSLFTRFFFTLGYCSIKVLRSASIFMLFLVMNYANEKYAFEIIYVFKEWNEWNPSFRKSNESRHQRELIYTCKAHQFFYGNMEPMMTAFAQNILIFWMYSIRL